MAVGTQKGIGFIDEELLNSVASHWARLNFGAAPAVDSLPAIPVRIKFGSNQGFSMVLRDGPRPAFRVPEAPAFSGHFTPTGAFFIGQPGKRNPQSGQFQSKDRTFIARGHFSTKGIGARRFLDAGLVALAENFGPAYRRHFEKVTKDAVAAHRGKT